MAFFSSLLGKDSARAASQLGQRNAGQINSGYDRADTESRTGYETATNRLMPYAQQGQAGFTAYNDALGLNGGDAQTRQFQTFQSSPFLDYARQNSGNETNAIFKRYGAQGLANSGATGLAVSRAAGERAQGDVQSYLNRLMQAGQGGQQVAGTMAGLDQSYYGGNADRAVGRSTALTNNDTQATMAANNARQAGVNNLLNVFGTAAGLGTRLITGGASLPRLPFGGGGDTGNDPGGTYDAYTPPAAGAWNTSVRTAPRPTYAGYAADSRRPWG